MLAYFIILKATRRARFSFMYGCNFASMSFGSTLYAVLISRDTFSRMFSSKNTSDLNRNTFESIFTQTSYQSRTELVCKCFSENDPLNLDIDYSTTRCFHTIHYYRHFKMLMKYLSETFTSLLTRRTLSDEAPIPS